MTLGHILCRRSVGDEMRGGVIIYFCEMHLVAEPGKVALLGVTRFSLEGAVDSLGADQQVAALGGASPLHPERRSAGANSDVAFP